VSTMEMSVRVLIFFLMSVLIGRWTDSAG